MQNRRKEDQGYIISLILTFAARWVQLFFCISGQHDSGAVSRSYSLCACYVFHMVCTNMPGSSVLCCNTLYSAESG